MPSPAPGTPPPPPQGPPTTPPGLLLGNAAVDSVMPPAEQPQEPASNDAPSDAPLRKDGTPYQLAPRPASRNLPDINPKTGMPFTPEEKQRIYIQRKAQEANYDASIERVKTVADVIKSLGGARKAKMLWPALQARYPGVLPDVDWNRLEDLGNGASLYPVPNYVMGPDGKKMVERDKEGNPVKSGRSILNYPDAESGDMKTVQVLDHEAKKPDIEVMTELQDKVNRQVPLTPMELARYQMGALKLVAGQLTMQGGSPFGSLINAEDLKRLTGGAVGGGAPTPTGKVPPDVTEKSLNKLKPQTFGTMDDDSKKRAFLDFAINGSRSSVFLTYRDTTSMKEFSEGYTKWLKAEGNTPFTVEAGRAMMRADEASLKKIQGILDSIQMSENRAKLSFEALDNVQKLWKQEQGKYPSFNAFYKSLAAATGNNAVKAFENSLATTYTEYMKVINAGGSVSTGELTVQGQMRAKAMLSIADNPEAFKVINDQSLRELDTSTKGIERQVMAIQKRLLGGQYFQKRELMEADEKILPTTTLSEVRRIMTKMATPKNITPEEHLQAAREGRSFAPPPITDAQAMEAKKTAVLSFYRSDPRIGNKYTDKEIFRAYNKKYGIMGDFIPVYVKGDSGSLEPMIPSP